MSEADALSVNDLRDRLYHSLREKGLVDALKSQLRNRLVTELKQAGLSKSHHQEPKYSKEGSLLHKAANSLVADHLRRCQYDYSLSVFLPETGSSEERLLTTQDLLQLLNVSPHSQLYQHLSSSTADFHRKGFLWQLLCEIASQFGYSKQDSGVQTDHVKLPPPTSLEEELRKVDHHYTSISDDWRSRSSAIEERILGYQRQLEERTHTELQLEKARFKENELARMRMEEREKCRQELEATRKEMERTYRAKSDALLERERNAASRQQQQEEITDREAYSKRQAVLDEIEIVRQKESQLRREQEVDKKDKDLWEQRMKAREEAAKTREQSARKAEIEYEQKLRNAMDQFKIEEQSRYLDRYKNVEFREARVKENELRLDDELQTIKQVKDELREKRIRVNELEADVVKTRHDLIGAQKQEEILSERLREMVDYQILKEESAVLRKELSHAKQRAAELSRDVMVERQKQEELLREMSDRATKPSPEVYLMQQQVEKMQNEVKQERAIFDHHRNQQERRLQEEIQRNHELVQKLEDQTLQQKHMNREMGDVQSQLFSTRQALSNEVYRKPSKSAVTSQIVALQQSLQQDVSDSLCSIEGGYHGNRENGEETDGLDGPDLMYDDPILDNILRRAPEAEQVERSQSDDYSYSSDLVVETKRRLKNLEREAENLEENYRNFQFRMTSVHTALDPNPARVSPNKSRVSFREHIATSTTRAAAEQSPYRSPRLSSSQSNTSRPLSSTPAYSTRSYNERNLYSPPAHEVDRDHPLVNAKVSPVHSPRNEGVFSRPRPLSVADLEARPGSPSIVVVPGSVSTSSQASKQGVSADLSFQDNISSRRPPASEDSPWKDTQQQLTSSLDAAWRDQQKEESDRRRKEEEDREYEEGRKRREEERRRREEEAWEREQKALRDLQRQEQGLPPEEEKKEKKEEKAADETGEPKIDPVMQKYMEMVKQKNEKDKQVAKKTIETWNRGRTVSQDKTPSQSEQDISVASEKSDKSDKLAGADDFW